MCKKYLNINVFKNFALYALHESAKFILKTQDNRGWRVCKTREMQ